MDIITNKSYKFGVSRLQPESEEFKTVKEFFDKSRIFENVPAMEPIFNFCLFKVFEYRPTKVKHQNNLMLLHGTSENFVNGILKNGFLNSKNGWYGKGVYMTDCVNIARTYSKAKCFSKYQCIFVNEVLESEKLQIIKFESILSIKDVNNVADICQFHKHINRKSPQPAETDYKKDSLGRKYRNVACDFKNIQDEYVARSEVTIPRYLIAFET